jgi:septum site-determining protein MinD
MSEPERSTKHILAILSGKGGSGKTMIAACLAAVMSENSILPVLLVDADFGTAGLTYYFGVKYVENSRLGISSMLSKKHANSNIFDVSLNSPAIQSVRGFPGLNLLSAGEPRQLERLEREGEKIGTSVARLIGELAQLDCHIVVDCRGGVDPDSIAICSAVDDIILVTEPDITAYQATRNVADVLSDTNLSEKLRGFVLNKVFQNPEFIRIRGTAEFRCRHLGSIPYDLDAARAFFIGDIPERRSTMFVQVQNVCYELYRDIIPSRPYRVWSDSDFDKVSSIDIEARRGGYFVALILALLFIAYVIVYRTVTWSASFQAELLIYLAVTAGVGILGTLSSVRRTLGRALSAYMNLLQPRRDR